MERWFEIKKGGNFNEIGKKFHISPVTARLIRNREIVGDDAIQKYLSGGLKDLYDPSLLKDGRLLADLLYQKIQSGKSIRIIGDYDVDGVMSSYILWNGITRCQGKVSISIPDRKLDGYGINMRLIQQAYEEGIDTIITCDNGIAAIEEISHAKELGMTVLVTDHHDIPFVEQDGTRSYLKSEADAIVNPKQQDCSYPFSGLCGAAVAWKVLQLLYQKAGLSQEESFEFLENVAFATVSDVMDLVDENRILVKEGLKRIHTTNNPGLKALIWQNNLEPEKISAYHFGFVLGPCINASGRLETAQKSLELFMEEDSTKAAQLAKELVELNIQRKDMTEQGVEQAMEYVEQHGTADRVLVIFLPDLHESLAGIIAGRVRERYNRPTLVLTKSENGVKGSGRSIEEYSMYEELCKCQEFFERFGGHPMAAGLSMQEKDIDAFREKINACCELTEEELIPKVKIDVALPPAREMWGIVQELDKLEPFGKGNSKPQFADRNLQIVRGYVAGRNRNVLRLTLKTEVGQQVQAVYFGDVENFLQYYRDKFGAAEVEKALNGKENQIRLVIIYYPEKNTYQGETTIQIVIRNFK